MGTRVVPRQSITIALNIVTAGGLGSIAHRRKDGSKDRDGKNVSQSPEGRHLFVIRDAAAVEAAVYSPPALIDMR